MNQAQSKPTKDYGEQSQAKALNPTATNLDLYEHEPFAFTEPLTRSSEPEPFSKRRSALLKAFYYWTHSRL